MQYVSLFLDLVLFSLPYYDIGSLLCRMVTDIPETTSVNFGMNAYSYLSFHCISAEYSICGA